MLRLLAVALGTIVFAAQPAARSIVVIGDLHMGPGRDASGNWHPYEDFRWRDEFIAFLDAVDRQEGDIDLVINGDLFELLQSTTVQCERTGCTPEEALQRLEAAIKAHADELAAIGKFAAAKSNRVHIVAGDHDAALLIPRLWERALAAFGAPLLGPGSTGRTRPFGRDDTLVSECGRRPCSVS